MEKEHQRTGMFKLGDKERQEKPPLNAQMTVYVDKDPNQIDTKNSPIDKTELVAQAAEEHQWRAVEEEQQMKVPYEIQRRGARLYHGAMQFTDVSTGAESQPYYLPRVEEEVEISDSMAVVSVPPPRFRPGDPAYILHDFNRKLTAYLDLTLKTCFVIPLNTSVVLPPQDLIDLFSHDSYRSYLVREDLVVTERIEDVKPLGFYIRRLCDGKETYRMQRRSNLPGGNIQKRSADDCFTIRHFENKFVTETRICKA
uniref:Integral membrane protein 2 n=1 Tax=Xiphophorus couchianus TaxID=32473 RepID=A0A3B5LP18_9TELE